MENFTYLTNEQIETIRNDEQFISKAKKLRGQLNFETYAEAVNEFMTEIIFTNRQKNFYTLKPEQGLTPQMHAHLQFTFLSIRDKFFAEKKRKQLNEFSMDAKENEYFYARNANEWHITNEEYDAFYHSDVSFGDRFSEREIAEAVDNCDLFMTAPSARFFKYLMANGQEATMLEWGLDVKHFNSKVASLINTLSNDKTQAKIAALEIHTDNYYEQQERVNDVEELIEMVEQVEEGMKSVEELASFILNKEGEDMYAPLFGHRMNYKKYLLLFSNWIGEKQLKYQLINNVFETVAYMKTYIYY